MQSKVYKISDEFVRRKKIENFSKVIIYLSFAFFSMIFMKSWFWVSACFYAMFSLLVAFSVCDLFTVGDRTKKFWLSFSDSEMIFCTGNYNGGFRFDCLKIKKVIRKKSLIEKIVLENSESITITLDLQGFSEMNELYSELEKRLLN